MPFADKRSGVAATAKEAGERLDFGGELAGRRSAGETRVWEGRAGNPIGEAKGGGRAAGEDGGAGRRADGRRGIGVSETEGAVGEGVEMGRVVVGVAVAAEVGLGEVVGDDEEDVGWRRRAGRRAGGDCGE